MMYNKVKINKISKIINQKNLKVNYFIFFKKKYHKLIEIDLEY